MSDFRATSRRSPKKPENNAAMMKTIVILLAVMTVAAICLGFFAFSQSLRNEPGEHGGAEPAASEPSQSGGAGGEIPESMRADIIYNNIFINGVPVGGLTYEQARGELSGRLAQQLGSREITLYFRERVYNFTYSDFNVEYDFDAALREALLYGKNGSAAERKGLVEALGRNPYKISAAYSFDENAVRSAVMTAAEDIDYSAKDAVMRRVNGEFVISSEIIGLKVDVVATALAIADLLRNGEGGLVEVVTTAETPRFTKAGLENCKSVIGTFSTTVAAGAGEKNRRQNIQNALSKINNVVVYPEEVFSTNEHFGEMTEDNGYCEANVIMGSKYEKDMGGGVCQVSSTLYMALLYAELEIVERQNHSIKISYVDYGYDATLAGNYIDLKFKNDTEYPVLIEGFMDGNKCTVNVYGYEIHSPGRKLEFISNQLSETEPPEDIITEDSDLPLGEIVEDSPARTGYRYELIKEVYADGALISSSRVNRSTYKATAAEKRIGTNPDLQRPQPQTPPDGPENPAVPPGGDPGEDAPVTPPPDSLPVTPDDWPEGIPYFPQ